MAWENRDNESALTRQSQTSGELFELLIVGWAGRHGEAVSADAGVSVMRGWPTKGLIETERLPEVDDDRDHHRSMVHSGTDAERWEASVARVAPRKCVECSVRLGPELLARTEPARLAVARYLSQLPSGLAARDARDWLYGKSSSEQRVAANRLRRWPGVLQVEGAELVYEVAALLVMRFASVAESQQALEVSADPLRTPELMWRIQLLRDRLAGLWPGEVAAA